MCLSDTANWPKTVLLSREIDIINKLGLHARAAAKLVKLSSTFEADIDIEKEGQRVNSNDASRQSWL